MNIYNEFCLWYLCFCLFFTSEKVITPLKYDVAFRYVMIVYTISYQSKKSFDKHLYGVDQWQNWCSYPCSGATPQSTDWVLSEQRRGWENTVTNINIHWKCLLYTRAKHRRRKKYNNVYHYVGFIQRVILWIFNEQQNWTIQRNGESELMRVWIDQIRCIVLFVEFCPIHLLQLTWDWIKLIQFKHHN